MRPPIEAVTFDFWDTLVRSQYSGTRDVRREKLIAVLGGMGHDVEVTVLDDAFDSAVAQHTEAWKANRPFTSRDGGLHVLERLELQLDHDQREAAVEAFSQAAADLQMCLTDNVVDVLDALAELGVGVGIVCDVGLTPSPVLRGYLDAHGVLERFDHWSFSDEVGVFKPDRRIFEHALEGLGGVSPERAAHVGDLRRTDVAGARGAGMTSVRYRGVNDDPDAEGELPEADHVLDDHGDLLEALGLA